MTDLSRRGFLLGFSAAGIVAAVGAPAAAAISGFDRFAILGLALPMSMSIHKVPHSDITAVIDKCLLRNARKVLPKGTRFEIRATLPRDWERTHGLAWIREPEMDDTPEWGWYKQADEPVRWIESQVQQPDIRREFGLGPAYSHALIAELVA